MDVRLALAVVPILIACNKGKEGEDACTTAAETMAKLDDCDASEDALVEQCQQFRSISTQANCTAQFDAWLECSTDWLSGEPDGVDIDCTDGIVSFGHDPSAVTYPCEDLNTAFWECTGMSAGMGDTGFPGMGDSG